MKYLKHFANAQEAATILATWPFNTISSIQGQTGASINVGVAPTPTGNDHYIGTINMNDSGFAKILAGGDSGSWTWYPDRVIVDGIELSELSDMIELSAGLHTVEIYDDPENSGYYTTYEDGGYFDTCSYSSMIIPDYVTSMYYTFNGSMYLTSVTITSGVTSIGENAFSSCGELTSVTIPDTVTSIGNNVFHSCFGLTSIAIPNSVTNIGDSVFCYCSGLTSVTIGSGVTSIGDQAFYDCNSLTSITCNTVNPPTLGNSVFDYTNDCPIYVPAASVDTYKAASGWSTYASRIQAFQS